jgi:hypothetical protein
VEALDGIKFEWKSDQAPKKTFKEWFTKLEEYKNTFNTVIFLGEERKIYKTLADWTVYAKLTAIKVLENKGKNSEFTLIHIKKLVDIGDVPHSNYSCGLDGAEDVDNKCTIAAVGEEMYVVQQTLPLAQSILEVPVNTAHPVLALPHPTVVPVPTENVAQSTAVATNNLTELSTDVLFPQEVSNTITPIFVHHSTCI